MIYPDPLEKALCAAVKAHDPDGRNHAVIWLSTAHTRMPGNWIRGWPSEDHWTQAEIVPCSELETGFIIWVPYEG